jgi:acetamidase/formamidase
MTSARLYRAATVASAVLTAGVLAGAQKPRTHRLEATPATISYGYYWHEAAPVLRIASGDIIETSLRGKLQLSVRKGMTLSWPRAETPTDYIAMATDEDLKMATTLAIQEMIDFLAASKNLSKHEAYQLVSIAGHVAITQLVDRRSTAFT